MKIARTIRRLMVVAPLAHFVAASAPAAGEIAVFGEKDFYKIESGAMVAAPKEADRAAFLESYRADVGGHAPFESALDLVSPPEWGRTVSAATRGKLQFHPSFPGGFACRISLENLLADHSYVLTLNGNPAKPGNSLLQSAVPGNAEERYYDFLIIRTDLRGHYDANLGVFLKPGSYDVRCYVKDTGDFKIVLYRDFFKFDVK
jgi:hypothetical protein